MITAHDVVKFYANVLTGSMSPADQDYLFGLLHRIAPVASDGFDQLFGVNGVESAPAAAVKIGATAHVAARPQAACTNACRLGPALLRGSLRGRDGTGTRVLGRHPQEPDVSRSGCPRAEASGEPAVEDGAQHGLTVLAGFGLLEAHLCAGAVESQDS